MDIFWNHTFLAAAKSVHLRNGILLTKCCFNLFSYFFQRKLGLYDFNFGAWPIDYKWDESKAEYVQI